ncbi:hypothetical protein A2765_04605 [Candidatus Kaiserbacteria bacterium RIFCSPHIGHO2_01_FULL_56_24]|uniref:Uncharacterized protein n=1 Tax=Candidatus Kaiserbacteria bacterium RIFCSPHIGHO2_01_FULL_56_24 TaxID=1798487 RepID=A0A1F6DEI0_9BACT|nr:MAG: hypothetical protein A2765_04605 [Candidatus Kaiserbacteria bacterium RIFCSPHIGHO2_01_FULL_56_24]
MEIVGTIWNIVSTFLAWVWSLLSILFGIWFIGPILQLAFIAGVAWILYKYTPRPIRSFVRQRVLPATGFALTPIQWYLTKLIAKPEWLRQPGDPAPQYIEKIVEVEVPVPVRRSFRSWFFSQMRTVLITLACVLVYVYWETVGPMFRL